MKKSKQREPSNSVKHKELIHVESFKGQSSGNHKDISAEYPRPMYDIHRNRREF